MKSSINLEKITGLEFTPSDTQIELVNVPTELFEQLPNLEYVKLQSVNQLNKGDFEKAANL